MPLIKVLTSVAPADDQRQALVAALSKIIATTIGKPEQYVMVTLETGVMLMSGQPGPAALAEVRSIGGLRPEVNKQIAQQVCHVLETSMGVPPDRVYLNFTEIPAADWGWRGGTFG